MQLKNKLDSKLLICMDELLVINLTQFQKKRTQTVGKHSFDLQNMKGLISWLKRYLFDLFGVPVYNSKLSWLAKNETGSPKIKITELYSTDTHYKRV